MSIFMDWHITVRDHRSRNQFSTLFVNFFKFLALQARGANSLRLVFWKNLYVTEETFIIS